MCTSSPASCVCHSLHCRLDSLHPTHCIDIHVLQTDRVAQSYRTTGTGLILITLLSIGSCLLRDVGRRNLPRSPRCSGLEPTQILARRALDGIRGAHYMYSSLISLYHCIIPYPGLITLHTDTLITILHHVFISLKSTHPSDPPCNGSRYPSNHRNPILRLRRRPLPRGPLPK